MGNEAMISRWPLRGGLVVNGGTVYFTAGMWPSEGVRVYALKAADGSVLWKTEGNGSLAPQGYMAANEKLLIAPVGRADAKLIERQSGTVREGRGMSQAILKGDLYLTGPYTHGANENLPVAGGLPFANRHVKLVAWDIQSVQGKQPRERAEFAGKEVAAVSDDAVYLAGRDRLAAHALKDVQRKWEIEFPRVFSLAVAGSTLIVGGDGNVALLDPSNGQRLWSGQVAGEAHGLAVANGRLLVSTDQGRIACFGPNHAPVPCAAAAALPLVQSERRAMPEKILPSPPGTVRSMVPLPKGEGSQTDLVAQAEKILRNTGIKTGLCLVMGTVDSRFVLELAKQSDLRIYWANWDECRVAAARKLLDRAGLYGTRVTVHHVASRTLPYPDYFANLIVVDQQDGGPLVCAAEELRRVLRPCGGTAYLISAPSASGG